MQTQKRISIHPLLIRKVKRASESQASAVLAADAASELCRQARPNSLADLVAVAFPDGMAGDFPAFDALADGYRLWCATGAGLEHQAQNN